MKRIYACIAIVGVLLSVAFYSSWKVQRCNQMRTKMNHLLRTADFTELEAALRAADGHLEMGAPEEAFGELRRAQVQVETLEWLSHRLV